MTRYVIALLLASISAPLFAQATVEQNRLLQRLQREAAIARQQWEDAHKLTIGAKEDIPDAPHRQGECMSPSALRDGAVGYLDRWHYEITQVASENELLLSMNNPDISPIWLKGYPTEGLADGDSVRLIGLTKVDGSKTYTTVLGAQKTIRVVRFMLCEEIAEMEAKAEAEEAAKRAAAEAAKAAEAARRDAALTRTWTDKSGQYSCVGKFLGFKSGKVQIQREDGKTIELATSKLCTEDQEWVRTTLKSGVLNSVQVVNTNKGEFLQEGPLRYSFSTVRPGLTTRSSNDEVSYSFNIIFALTNTSEDESVKSAVWSSRFKGATLTDNTGQEYAIRTRIANYKGQSPGTPLRPSNEVDYTFRFEGKPNPKAMMLIFSLPESDGRPAVQFIIPRKK